MPTDLLYELDTSGDTSRRSSRLIYTTNGDLEQDITSKPSQERPAILKCKAKRYHQSDDKKKFIPGKLSSQLRKALGLCEFDIPVHIYRMRYLGYPPGWLRKAEIKSEGITIFGADNSIINSTDGKVNVKYDCDKLHEYPGFNSYHMYDYRYDHCMKLGFMPMQEDCLLENFKRFLWNSQLLGKEATDIRQIRLSSSLRNSENDFNLPLKRSNPMAVSTPNKPIKRPKVDLNTELSDGEVLDDDDDMDISDEYNPPVSKEITTEEGTVLIVPTVINKPSLDRFSEGINEHRLFENLPNVGGTYKKVREVLRKVRN